LNACHATVILLIIHETRNSHAMMITAIEFSIYRINTM
jgi:hypothetical protein